ncbi:MAG: hypothetical protein Q9211_006243, partial [Gyalolechia sp. 1 TL-2023]
MAALNRKRGQPEAPSNSRKKHRKEINGLKERKESKTSVGLDALPWSEARLPDRLDDAEGFFGLEEVSDVEVVKDQQLGRLEYRLSRPAADTRSQDGETLGEGEWDGFSDSNIDMADTIFNQAKPTNGSRVSTTSNVRSSNDPALPNRRETISISNGFNMLKEASDDEID